MTTLQANLARYAVRPAGDLGYAVVDHARRRSVGWFAERGAALRERIEYAVAQTAQQSEKGG